jgi:Spy/CpxP family protein refolding chaperone
MAGFFLGVCHYAPRGTEHNDLLQEELLMNKNRFAKPVAIAAGVFFLCAAPGLTRGQSSPSGPAQTPKVASPGAPQKRDSAPPDDFAGLTYTGEQKAEIADIHRDSKSRQDAVVKDEKLTADQKDAMLLGYTRMEYGRIYRVLTPEQQRQIKQRIRDRRAADQAAKNKQIPRN